MMGTEFNQLNATKRKYIIEMRKCMIEKDVIYPDGSLNLKYFNVKKGQYWSNKEHDVLIKAVIAFGPAAVKGIKSKYFPNRTETEIKLRL
jgi:hypothetical protein